MAVSNETKHEWSCKLLGYSPMEHIFRSLKSEWVTRSGYHSITEAKNNIINYITGYYSQVRPHTFNNDLTPNASESKYWTEYNSVAK